MIAPVHEDSKLVKLSHARAIQYLVAVKHERDIEQLLVWLASRTYLRTVRLALVHVVEPAWLEHDPDSSLGGFRMLNSVEKSAKNKLKMLETGARKIRMQFPQIEVDYWLKTGDPLAVLPDIVKSVNADALLVFGGSPEDRPFWERSFAQRIANKCPCPLECFERV